MAASATSTPRLTIPLIGEMVAAERSCGVDVERFLMSVLGEEGQGVGAGSATCCVLEVT